MGRVILPGSTIGILGGGQLGRMIALEGRRMGYRFVTLDPTPDCPCAQVSDRQIVAAYDDVAAAEELARSCDVITYEFENVSHEVAATLAQQAYVPQGSRLLWTTQHRVREKSTLAAAGVDVTPFHPVESLADLEAAAATLGLPLVLKTSTGGYDGKGQWRIDSRDDLTRVWREASGVVQATSGAELEFAQSSSSELAGQPEWDVPFIAEAWVNLECELSAVVARSPQGEVRVFPVAENEHKNHILHLSIVPARVSEELRVKAESVALRVAEALDVIGLVAVEMFVTKDGQLYVNELAPRPHNSGHYTYDACATSQFEQHVRAICNLPLGDVTLWSPVVMVNVLGQHLEAAVEAAGYLPPNAKLHLYGKAKAAVNRKMGHLTVLGSSVDAALQQIEALGIWSE
ncbi:5-(carboxyamino)imidazole ribonucleotide synthase [Alicyclobacillus sp. ALC3]|uniref:5-(carboxyamino)imidazole ribonucleotide synthase n=1 Tax=Alicyclobacillus sp. ALC3 TaxID=2796143 RepID=UPI00237854D0|nr:5-(carboxyamino)imidazole ribonucleotide synthase [Alicyclobacillus sp. ALC3]WDL99495.1 5-(carboxyamino)imidazole ribonucleotide synthase [Alicyclobacillus sp. ALC3]